MTGKTVEYTVLFSSIDDVTIAIVPEMPGCMSEGETVAEALENIRDALEACLEYLRDEGRDIPKPRSYAMTKVTVSLPDGIEV